MLIAFVVPTRLWRSEIGAVADRAHRALGAARRAGPGDMDDALQFGRLLREIEMIVRRLAAEGKCKQIMLPNGAAQTSGTPEFPWADEYRRIVERSGEYIGLSVVFAVPVPDEEQLLKCSPSDAMESPLPIWRSRCENDNKHAEEERFRQQLVAAVSGSHSSAVLTPSDFGNFTLTECLREFVQVESGAKQQVRVVYRDGSEARPFPLRVVKLVEKVPENLPVVRVALMSLRHPEMDCEVDAAWFRNRDLSVIRPTAETDEYAYTYSCVQLKAIAAYGPRIIHLYQTGFPPAVIGFYRAMTNLMIEEQRGLFVLPVFYISGKYKHGKPWGINNG